MNLSPYHFDGPPMDLKRCAAFVAVPGSSSAKRLYDVLLSALGLVVLSPMFLAIGALIKLTSRGPVFYHQPRVGLRGRLFEIWKFRTMLPSADQAGPAVTREGDARITWLGSFLRKTKMDELPQLWNVFKGDMSLVGPRPEVPRYVEYYSADQRLILQYKPGITDQASLLFRNEELLLRNAEDLEQFYIEQCLPRKLQLNFDYARRSNLLTDTWIIVQTLCPYWFCVLTTYGFILTGSFWVVCVILYDFSLPTEVRDHWLSGPVAVITVQLGALFWRKQCKGLVSYFDVPEIGQVTTGLGVACLLLLGLWAITGRGWPSWNFLVLDFMLSLFALCGFRLLLRFWREMTSDAQPDTSKPQVRVAIVGAGESGVRLARELMTAKRARRTVVAFFDDDCRRWQKRIHEVPVIGMPECLLEGWNRRVDEVIVAMPDAPEERVLEISEELRKAGVTAYRAPLDIDDLPTRKTDPL